jgi:hypothetical protein
MVNGIIARFEVDTVPDGTAVYKQFAGEIDCSLDIDPQFLESANKDNGKWASSIKTMIKAGVSINVEESIPVTSGFLGYTDAFALSIENYSDTNKGERLMKITMSPTGGHVISFTGLLGKVAIKYANNELISWSAEIVPIGEIVLTPVA